MYSWNYLPLKKKKNAWNFNTLWLLVEMFFSPLLLPPCSPPANASLPAGPPPQIPPDEAEQKAVHLLACSSSSPSAPLPPISMFDLLQALQVRRRLTEGSRTVILSLEKHIYRIRNDSFQTKLQKTELIHLKHAIFLFKFNQ